MFTGRRYHSHEAVRLCVAVRKQWALWVIFKVSAARGVYTKMNSGKR